MEDRDHQVPILLDIAVLRPLGVVITVGGLVAWVPATAFTAFIRPTEIHRPWQVLVAPPVRFTWLDPLGHH